MNKDQMLKLIAGESIGVVTVQMRQRDSETKRVIIDELVRLKFDKTSVTMVASDDPESLYLGAKLDLSDLRSDIVLHLGLTKKQDWFRRVLQRHFRAEIEEYREMLWALKTLNLDPVMPRHFQVACAEEGLLRRQTPQGYLMVKRQVVPEKLTVSFTLIHAPKEHELAKQVEPESVIVDYIDGRPGRYAAGSPQSLFMAELSSFGKVTTTVTAW